MSTQTALEWRKSAQQGLAAAAKQQLVASSRNKASRKAHAQTLGENLDAYGHLDFTLRGKVNTLSRLVNGQEQRACSLEATLAQLRDSSENLEGARKSFDLPLEVCAWRLEQRSKRPLCEQVRDVVEVALDAEKAAHRDMLLKVTEAQQRTKRESDKLKHKLEELNSDLEGKRQALDIDRLCLRTTHPNWQDKLSGVSLRKPATKKTYLEQPRVNTLEMESARNEDRRHQLAQSLCDSAAAAEVRARKLCGENQNLIQRCCEVLTQMSARTRKSFDVWMTETRQMAHRVESELQSVDSRIEQTKRTILETSAQLQALEEPMELCSTRAAWRRQRAHDEDIHDPVAAKLSQNRAALLKTEQELRSHNKEEKKVLLGLMEHRTSLAKDLSCKHEAMQIDFRCISSESVRGRAATPNRSASRGGSTGRSSSVPVGSLRSRHMRPAHAWPA